MVIDKAHTGYRAKKQEIRDSMLSGAKALEGGKERRL